MLYYFSNIRLTKEYNAYSFKAKKVTPALDYYPISAFRIFVRSLPFRNQLHLFQGPCFSNLEKKTRFFLEDRRSFRFKIGVKDLIWLPLTL